MTSSTKVPIAEMPKAVRAAKYSLIALLAALLMFFLKDIAESLFNLAMIIVCGAAIVGLIRNLAWGRFLTSCIGVFSAFGLLSCSMSDPSDHYVGLVERLAGHELVGWSEWLIVMTFSSAPLILLAIIGIRKDYFRNEMW